jgi:peptidoglycan hydrolase CwlO-like protein
MYEPYGENKKKVKFDFSQIREKIKEKLGDLNFGDMNKMAFVVGALFLLISLGGITGYVTYTGKVEEMEKRYMIMERQIQGLQEELGAVNQNLNTCNANLESTRNNLEMQKQELSNTMMTLDQTRSDLGICNSEKSDLSNEILLLEEDVGNLNKDLNDLEDDYDELTENFDYLGCNVAKMSSCEYYKIEGGSKVVCCFKFEGNFICSGNVVEDGVKEVDC